MKKTFFLLLLLALISCNKNDGSYDLYNCSCPKEILSAGQGQDIYWDCSWQAAYNNGKVKLVTDENGKLLAITKTYKQ